MLTRRNLLLGSAALALASAARAQTNAYEITLSEDAWRARLTPAQFRVLREKVTEHPFTNHLGHEASPLLVEDRPGTYNCAGCALELYRSETKYDSRTGWPSFWREIDGNVLRYDDSGLFIRRTGLECRRCGGHIGHVFDDGPAPTGERHCLNGLALTFTPDATGVIEGGPVPYA